MAHQTGDTFSQCQSQIDNDSNQRGLGSAVRSVFQNKILLKWHHRVASVSRNAVP